MGRRVFNGAGINKLRSRRWLYDSLINKKRKRTTTKATSLCSYRRSRHLPEDLLPEILRRLPVKSLLRFRCVSKTWLTLVDDDADFARLHLDTFKNNRDQTRLFVVEGWRPQIFSVRSSDTFESISEIPYVDQGRDFILPWKIVSSVDGLVLLSLNESLKLWNPSLRVFHDVPPGQSSQSINRSSYKKCDLIGLGYDLLLKDYKIVRLDYDFGSELPSVEIYTVGAGSWKTIPFRSNGSSVSRQDIFWSRSFYVQGSLYFLYVNFKEGRYFLSSFDLSNEVFSCISTSSCVYMPRELFLLDGGSSLGVYAKNSIWVLERDTMNWTKRCLWNNLCAGFTYCKKNGDMLTTKTNYEKQSSGVEVASYCLEKDEFKVLQPNLSCGEINNASTYVESLILNKL